MRKSTLVLLVTIAVIVVLIVAVILYARFRLGRLF